VCKLQVASAMRIEPVSDGASIRLISTPKRRPHLNSSRSSNGTLICDARIGFIGFCHPRWLVDPFMDGAQRGFAVPTHALCGHKSGHSETTCENTGVTYVFDFTYFYGAQRGFEPLTHALRIRRSLLGIIRINNLRIHGAVYGKEKRRKSACAGTKVAAAIDQVLHLRSPQFMMYARAASCAACSSKNVSQ
jgi:hypothetical protein